MTTISERQDVEERSEQAEVIAFLSDATNYAETGDVKRIDTHISHVFLVGDQAYKLKRAVKMEYIDFSTIQKRRDACQKELALNRRTAPEIYQEVRSINLTVDGKIGFEAGEPVDWLVVMRRFDANGLLEAVAERGELSMLLVTKLADTIASFHQSITPRFNSDGHSKVVEVIDENRLCMSHFVSEIFAQPDVEDLYQQSKKRLSGLTSLLDHRALEGHIRHCHGDLHLANICIWKGEPTLFDCLEFSEELATTDTLYDVAFLLMDLWHRGLHIQASELFNRYLYMSEGAEGLATLPLFLSMRAAIRAHVTASQAQLQPDSQERLQLIEKAKAYAETALQFLRQSSPQLLAVGGLSGTGKSTLARALAPSFGAPIGAHLLRTDILRKRLFGVTPETHLDEQAYTRDQSARVYALLLQEVEQALQAGWTVIADGVFADEKERQQIAALAESHNVPFTGIWLEAPLEKLCERVDQRTADASDADSGIVQRQSRYDIGDLKDWTVVNSSGGPEQVADEVRVLLGRPD